MVLSQRIAYVDLSSGKIKTDSISSDLRRLLLGGRGLDAYLILNYLKTGADALSPENVIVIGAGFLAGMLAPASGRTDIASKSPLTGYLDGTNLGGFFAPELRRAGFDHLVITGKAKKPSMIMVHGGKVRILDASRIWGQTIPDTQEILRKELEDDNIQTLCIGPAGENRVRFGSVGTRHEGSNGRSGMGAVFGSKNLKAVIARGEGGIAIWKPAEALDYDKKIVHDITASEFGRRLGTLGVSNLDGIEDDMFSEQTIGMDGCYGCQLHCRRRYVVRAGPYAGTYSQGPGYLEQQAWVRTLGHEDADAILVANHLANSYGLDSLETASLVDWAIRLNEEKILGDKEINSDSLRRSDPAAIIRLIGMISRRDGFGDVLADGGVGAAARIGKGSAAYLREIKGVADISSDHAVSPWQALGVATAARGTDHLRFLNARDPCHLSWSALKGLIGGSGMVPDDIYSSDGCDYANAPMLVRWTELNSMMVDALGVCQFQSILFDPHFPGADEFAQMISLNAGFDLSAGQILEACERAITLERSFNLREGYAPSSERLDNWYPAKEYEDRESCLEEDRFNSMLGQYYRVHSWDEEGVPTNDTLSKLGVGQILKPGPRR